MNTIKFISDDPKEKLFATAVRKRVNDYFNSRNISVKGDSRMYFKASIMISLYLAPFICILFIPMNGWIMLLLWVLMGIGEAGIGMSVMHDAAHGAFSAKEWINKLFASTMFLLGSNTYNWKIQHNVLHHTYTNIYGYDQDIETKAIIRLCPHTELFKFHKFQHIYAFPLYGLMTLFKFFADFIQLASFNRSGMTKKQNLNPKMEMFKLIVIKVVYLSLIIGLPIVLTDFKVWQILLGFALMHITAGAIMSTTFQMAHVVEGTLQPLPDAENIIHSDWVVHQLSSTSDFARGNHFLNWFIGGLNFQIEHHLFPNTCHIHYRSIAPIVESTANEFGFFYNLKPSLRAALVSHMKRLKELGT